MSEGQREPLSAVDARPRPSSPLSIALAWLVVGTPLLWGIYETWQKARQLFP